MFNSRLRVFYSEGLTRNSEGVGREVSRKSWGYNNSATRLLNTPAVSNVLSVSCYQ